MRPTPHDIALAAQSHLVEATSCVIFDAGLNIVHSAEVSPTAQDLVSLCDAYGARDAAIQRGIHLGGRRFEVHRHHPPLIYGRAAGDADDAEAAPGLAVCRVPHSVLGGECYVVITYEMPNTSARMVTALRHFVDTVLAERDGQSEPLS